MVSVEPLAAGHEDELLRFELENRAYFTRFISDRGDAYFAEFPQRLQTLLEFQEAGTDHLHVLVDDGRIVGRVNLIDITDGSAELGYRIAESAAGRGLATWAVRKVISTPYGLKRITAVTTTDNLASQKILHRTGFTRTGETDIKGHPGYSYVLMTAQTSSDQ